MTLKVKSSVNLLTRADIARIYSVSRPTAGNWVADALNRANGLQITEDDGRVYILDIPENHARLASLKEKGVKFKNRLGYQKIVVDPKVYKGLQLSELVDLVTGLEQRHIPNRFHHMGEAGKIYNDYIEQQEKKDVGYEGVDMVVNDAMTLSFHLKNYEEINLVDLGHVTGALTSIIIENLLKEGKRLKYTAIGQTDEIFKILKRNLNKKFPDLEVKRESQNMSRLSIRDNLFFNKQNSTYSKTCNLMLFLDYSIGNYKNWKSILQNISSSMSENDYLYFSSSYYSFSELNFLENLFVDPKMVKRNLYFVGYMGITEDLYEVKHGFNDELDSLTTSIKFNKDVDLCFKISGKDHIVSFLAGQEVVVYMVHSFTQQELFSTIESLDLEAVNYMIHPDADESLILCRTKS